MNLEELYKILLSTGMPVAHLEFCSEDETEDSDYVPPKPPFIVYVNEGRRGILADDTFWKKVNPIRVELYSDKKDLAAEEALEKVLDDAGIIYTMDEVGKIESENLYEIAYFFEI